MDQNEELGCTISSLWRLVFSLVISVVYWTEQSHLCPGEKWIWYRFSGVVYKVDIFTCLYYFLYVGIVVSSIWLLPRVASNGRIHEISPGFTNHRLVSHKDANLQSAGHAYSTCSIEYSYTQPTAIRDYYKYSFYPRTITECNKLPRDTALSNWLAAFKNAVSNFYWRFYYFALISATSVTFVFLCLFVCLFFLERSKMLKIEWKT